MATSQSTEGPLLVAVDFSHASLAAVAWAAAEARVHDRTLLLLHVVHDPDDAPGYYRRDEEDSEEADSEPIEDVAARAFDAFLAACRAELGDLRALGDVETVLVSGLPATRIVEVARERGAVHVVMGSRGRTGLRHLIGGSTAQRVAQLSPVPVTIVKAPEPPPADEDEDARPDGEAGPEGEAS